MFKGLNKKNSVLFINDTFDDYHFGCSGTSLAIREKLGEMFDKLDSIPIGRATRDQNKPPLKYSQFIDKNYFLSWSKNNSDIVYKIKQCSYVVINGEGCISRYNRDTCALLYLAYAAKVYFKKKVAIINHSVFINNYVDNLSDEDQLEYERIIKLTYSVIDYSAVREYKSLLQINSLVPGKSSLSFDSLPVYIDEYFNEKPIKHSDYILVSGGNYIDETQIKSYIVNFYQHYSNEENKRKILFLYSEIKNSPCIDDMHLYRYLKSELLNYNIKIQLYKATDLDDWLSVIKNTSMLISGRFHHSIAAFMFDRPFVAFKTNTPKLEAILGMMHADDRLIDENVLLEESKRAYDIMNKKRSHSEQYLYGLTRQSLICAAYINFQFGR